MDDQAPNKDLDRLRNSLRQIDDEIVALVVRRLGVAKDIGLVKKRHSIPILDPKREAFNSQRNRELARGYIPEPKIDKLTEMLANWAREIQQMAH